MDASGSKYVSWVDDDGGRHKADLSTTRERLESLRDKGDFISVRLDESRAMRFYLQDGRRWFIELVDAVAHAKLIRIVANDEALAVVASIMAGDDPLAGKPISNELPLTDPAAWLRASWNGQPSELEG